METGKNRLDQTREWFGRIQSGGEISLRLLYGGLGVLILLCGSHDLRKDYLLQHYGINSHAAIMDTYFPLFSRGPSYRAHYSYLTASGEEYIGSDGITKSEFDKLKAGNIVAIHYVSYVPSISKMNTTFNNTDAGDMFFILIFLFPVSLWLLFTALRKKSPDDGSKKPSEEFDVSNDSF